MEDIFEKLRKKENSHESITGFDFFSDLWMLQDANLLELIDLVKENNINFDSDFLQQLKKRSNEEIKAIQSKIDAHALTSIEHVNLENFYKNKKCHLTAKININSIEQYKLKFGATVFDSYYGLGVSSPSLKNSYPEALDYNNLLENAIYLDICEYLFDKYKQEYTLKNFDYRSLMVPDTVKAELNRIYGDSALCKYNLFKLNLATQEIVNDGVLPYIFDRNNEGNYLMLNYKYTRLLDILKDLISKGYINDISLNIKSIQDKLLIFEEKKYGQGFSLNLENLPDVSVFYDLNNTNDHLWVYVNNEVDKKFSVVFEETIDDFYFDKNENVITNLIHLEVTNKNGVNVISHIDHEYIIYSMNTYIKRLSNSAIKGEHKIKTFKIDNSTIPLNYKFNNCNILYHIVHECMDKKSLIKEYFETLA